MSLRHTILGLLSIRPMSGYELKKISDQSVGHFWTADQSQIYRTLAGLVEDGLATRRTVLQDDRPNLHVHSATEEGLAELDRWLSEPLAAQPVREPLLAKLFFAGRLPVEQVRAVLDDRRAATRAQLEQLRAIPTPSVVEGVSETLRLATLAYGIAQAQTELDWLDATDRALDRYDA